VFVGVLTLTSIWAHLQPRVYEAAGGLQLHRKVQFRINSESDFDESGLSKKLPTTEEIELGNVVRRMSDEDRSALLRPYGYGADAGSEVVANVLRRNFRIMPKPLSRLAIILYRHPSPEVALKMADLFMEECLARHCRLREQEIKRMVEEMGQALGAAGSCRSEFGRGIGECKKASAFGL